MQKILIIGKGQLGQAYFEYFSDQGWNTKIADKIDIRDYLKVEKTIREVRPGIVINTAGKTNIDWCEDHPYESAEVIIGGSLNLALAAREVGAYMIHFGSGDVFDGDENYAFTEEDEPNFKACVMT